MCVSNASGRDRCRERETARMFLDPDALRREVAESTAALRQAQQRQRRAVDRLAAAER